MIITGQWNATGTHFATSSERVFGKLTSEQYYTPGKTVSLTNFYIYVLNNNNTTLSLIGP